MRRLPFITLIAFMAFTPLALKAQEAVQDLMDEDLESLFAEDSEVQDLEEPAEEEESGSTSKAEKEVDLLNDVVRESDKWTLGGNFRFVGGYSSGYTYMPWDVEDDEEKDTESMALMDMNSAVSLDFQVGPEFRVYQKYSVSFPDMEIEISELFCDYNVKERVFARLGRQNLTWGESRNFPFTNLTARVPEDFAELNDDPDLDDADSYALKVDVPIMVGGLQGIAFTRNGFMEDPDAPAADEIGYGGYANLATSQFDLTVGSYYHKDLNTRAYYSLSTTLFHELEVYQEGMVSYDHQGDDIDPDSEDEELISDRMDISMNIGFYLDFFGNNLKLNGEYFYCGEETELDLKNSSYPLMWGHNLAASVSYRPGGGDVNLFSKIRYNSNENSGILIPGLSYDGLPYLTLTMATPLVWGSKDGGYYEENPDDLGRPLSFMLMAVISGKI